MDFELNRLRDYSSLFSRGEVLSWFKGDFSSINFKIKRYDANWLIDDGSTYLQYLKYIYKVLTQNYRNEYIFKNEFLNEYILQELGTLNSKVFSEFKIGNSIADLALFNGVSKIFEIKTELDSPNRLKSQLSDYRTAFNCLYLIVPVSKLKLYENQDITTGLILYDHQAKHGKFELYRNPQKNEEIDPNSIMSILHTNEYRSIVKDYFGELPEMTSFTQYKICKELILEIPMDRLNQIFISTMKQRGSKEAILTQNHAEFNQISLALKFNKKKKDDFLELLETKISP